MKKITVTYSTGCKILTVEDNSAYFDQENVSLQIDAKIETDKKVRAYIKAANGNSDVTDAIETVDGVYSVPIEDKYMSKGILYVGFEAYDDTGYDERYEPLKVYVDSSINHGEGYSNNVYVITEEINDEETLQADVQVYAAKYNDLEEINTSAYQQSGTAESGSYYITPQQFGAIGDGVADDTQAIVNAIEASINEESEYYKRPVYIPSGIYNVFRSINLYTNTKIFGDGENLTTIRSRINDKSPVFISDGVANASGTTDHYNISIENLTIQCDGVNSAGIVLNGTHYWNLTNISILQARFGGLKCFESYIGEMRDCTINGCGYHPDYGSQFENDCAVSFSGNTAAYACHGINIYGGHIQSLGKAGLSIGGGQAVSIYGTIVEGCVKGYGIFVTGANQAVTLSGIYTEANALGDVCLDWCQGLIMSGCSLISEKALVIGICHSSLITGNYIRSIHPLHENSAGCVLKSSFIFGNGNGANGGIQIDETLKQLAYNQGTLFINEGNEIELNAKLRYPEGINVSSNKNYNITVVGGTGNPHLAVNENQGSLFLRGDGEKHNSCYYKMGYGTSGWQALQSILFGSTANRPTAEINSPAMWGLMYFDSTLGKPIWYNAVSGKWVDATGTVV